MVIDRKFFIYFRLFPVLIFYYFTSMNVSVNATHEGCPPKWKYASEVDKCYRLYAGEKDYQDAKQACLDKDATLAMPKTLDQINALYIYLTFNDVWIGMDNVLDTDLWQWVDGSNVTTEYWDIGEPDNGGVEDGEDCIVINQDGLAQDVPCFYQYDFICESETNVPNCNNGLLYDNKCYINSTRLTSQNKRDYFDAMDKCLNWGGTLYTPTVGSLEAMKTEKVTSSGFKYMIFPNDLNEEGVFIGITNEPLLPNFVNWDNNQPDNVMNEEQEDCGSLEFHLFRDSNCSKILKYICEMEPVPVEVVVWNEWGNWSECSATCGESKRSRSRNCTTTGGGSCEDIQSESESCSVPSCLPGICPDTWTPGLRDGICYKPMGSVTNYTTAVDMCAYENAALPTPKTMDEIQFLSIMYTTLLFELWIGLTNVQDTPNWVWSDSSFSGPSDHWCDGNPSNGLVPYDGEDCLVFSTTNKIYTEACFNTFGIVCKKLDTSNCRGIVIDQNCYWEEETPMSRDDGQATCQYQNGDLLRLQDVELYSLLLNLTRQDLYYIQAMDRVEEGIFVYDDESQFQLSPSFVWAEGEPSNDDNGLQQDCATLKCDLQCYKSTKCSLQLPVLCQMDINLETTSSPVAITEATTCMCGCPKVTPNYTSQEIQQTLDTIRSENIVEKKSLSSTFRKLNSADDGRESSKNIGAIGVLLLSSVVMCIVFPDVINIVRFFLRNRNSLSK